MSTILITLLALTSTLHVTSTSGDVGFEPFDCYRDICESRRQYCSDREQRCKYCQPVQCMDSSITPQQCRAICPELLNTPTATAPTTTTTTTTTTTNWPRSVNAATTSRKGQSLSVGKQSSRDGFYIPNDITMVLVIVVVVSVLLSLAIAITNCINIKQLRQQLQPTTPKERCPQALEEEGQPFLGQQWGSKYSNRSTASASPSTVSSQPPKQAIHSVPSPLTEEMSTQTEHRVLTESSPQYTARPNSQLFRPGNTVLASATEDDSTSDKHERCYKYQLLGNSKVLPAQDYAARESAAHPSLFPGPGGLDIMVTSSGQSLPLPLCDETNPKSL